ncbi:D-alanyl-D-alanine carboxypeptidase/D-alanyl-D-alanine-endopeptidase [Asaia sp. As-1742]|nr:D-alanyl-D-alanine carboxypeptidase/D-alanyl-D-alanine-endopeptidase [Asaia sp. As-1742]
MLMRPALLFLAPLSLTSALGLSACVPAPGHDRLAAHLAPLLAPMEARGARWGILVTDDTGRVLYARHEGQRFVPASNAKLFTTAAALVAYDTLTRPPYQLDTALFLAPRNNGAPNLILRGAADPFLSAAQDCAQQCLTDLADSAARAGLKHVHAVIGDDTLFADTRWGDGWSWNNLSTRYGTAISALTLDDNVASLIVTPGPGEGAPATVSVITPAYRVVNHVVTRRDAAEAPAIRLFPGNDTEHGSGTLTGTIKPGSTPLTVHSSIIDPAQLAARQLADMLVARGVRVDETKARHRPEGEDAAPQDLSFVRLGVMPQRPLAIDIRHILKDSQNLHAELLLRRLGLLAGKGTVQAGLEEREKLLASSGVDFSRVSLADGSGMSPYDRATPRDIVSLLLWAQHQRWGGEWADDLPLAATDGTLSHRFEGTVVAGRLHAKTGTLNGTHALSGYLVTTSGHRLILSILLNDVPELLSVATVPAKPLSDVAPRPAVGERPTDAIDRVVEALAAVE